jgi:two-component system response regulator PilR (NtrC family)
MSERNKRVRVLIVEDDPLAAQTLEQAVEMQDGNAEICTSLSAAIAAVTTGQFDVFLLDYHLPDGNGATFFHHLRSQNVVAPCIMLTGVPELSTAVSLTRHGLFDYLTKPVDLVRFADVFNRAVLHALAAKPDLSKLGLVGSSAAMQRVRHMLQQATANLDTTVLITGETGVGKDLVARVLHRAAFGEKDEPFIAVNCSTLPAEMFEAELFGAQKGAYTGAHQHREGLVEAAQGGTLFLDEIAEVPLRLQAKLLHLLEAREYRMLGSTGTKRFNGRISAATNRSLELEVRAERFRADLWYRLDVFNIEIPPLRERREDIGEIAEALLDNLSRKSGRTKPALRPEDIEALQRHNFPGNVRELRNILERSLLLTAKDSPWLQLDSSWSRRAPAAVSVAQTSTSTTRIAPARDLSPVEQQEYALIQKTLVEEGGFIRRAAARLGMSHQALLRRLEKWPELRVPQAA